MADGDVLTIVAGHQAYAAPTGGVQTVLSATTILTDADIKALPTTPVEIVPAQGVGATTVVLMVLAVMSDEGHGYTNLDATACQIYTLMGSGGVPTTTYDENMYGVLATAGPADVLVFTPNAAVAGAAVAAVAGTFAPNLSVRLLGENNGAGNWTGGDPANTMTVTVIYTVIEP